VDAFRGPLLQKTNDAMNSFILTHYHGDHYGSLPRDLKYQGPALIHCTPTTAALLVRVHLVPAQFVCPHEYGETWWAHHSKHDTSITFYDANHCPGAAIVVIELLDGTCHLHCGDMRYHDKMKSYPKLAQAVQEKTLDLVYLDTTYGHPKHDFMPQEEAIQTIAGTVQEELSKQENTLILLSCYSIGKEKVLWECASRTNQLVHVTEKKHKMLECILQGEGDVSHNILEKCTLDPGRSDIHVIPMGLAGEIWPYFRPNYWKCAEYAEELNKQYDRIVAFLPTGWANASNWNKKNSVTSKEVDYKTKGGSVKVEIQLVSYSEHSAFSELVSFVDFLKPRKVIPTVFGDDNDRRKIENHFRNKVNSTRAKQNFFKDMTRYSPVIKNGTLGSVEKIMDIPTTKSDTTSKKRKASDSSSGSVGVLVAMGFEAEAAIAALNAHSDNLEAALNDLLYPVFRDNSKKPSSQESPIDIDVLEASAPAQTDQLRTIARFFAKKEEKP